MIKSIKLTNFRRFEDVQIDITKDIVVLYGNNAQGKSTILEAIYLLTNGKSPWAVSDEFVNNTQNDEDKFARIEIATDEHLFAFFKDQSRRVCKIDNMNTTPKKFFQSNASTIFNPEQIEILMISPSRRRDFLDEVISQIDYEYNDTLAQFRKVLRQRNAYLKKLAKKFYEQGIIARNDTQLNFWTNEFVNLSKIIQTKRLELIDDLSSDGFTLEYIKSNKEELEECIENAKKRDIVTGCSNIGPQRDDWEIIVEKNIKKYGSRGEKRLAIGNLIFRVQDVLNKKLGFYPILLLDDIASELDPKNTHKIFGEENIKKQQTFITIINHLELPEEILKNAQLIDLNNI
jgi:DNA replication and repair protein RecF